MDSALPTLLAGLTTFASTGDGATQLTNLINQGNHGSILNNLPSLLSGGNALQSLLSSGRDILAMLFGGKLSSVIDLIAKASGIKTSSASSLLSLAAPLILGVVGKQGLSSTNLLSLLTGQKDLVHPPGPGRTGRHFRDDSGGDAVYRPAGLHGARQDAGGV